jgi:hypothetical protein
MCRVPHRLLLLTRELRLIIGDELSGHVKLRKGNGQLKMVFKEIVVQNTSLSFLCDSEPFNG